MVINYASGGVIYDRTNVYSTGHSTTNFTMVPYFNKVPLFNRTPNFTRVPGFTKVPGNTRVPKFTRVVIQGYQGAEFLG